MPSYRRIQWMKVSWANTIGFWRWWNRNIDFSRDRTLLVEIHANPTQYSVRVDGEPDILPHFSYFRIYDSFENDKEWEPPKPWEEEEVDWEPSTGLLFPDRKFNIALKLAAPE